MKSYQGELFAEILWEKIGPYEVQLNNVRQFFFIIITK